MKKSFLFIVLTLVCNNIAAYDCCINGIYYLLDHEKKEATVTCNNAISDQRINVFDAIVTIPESIKFNNADYNVTAIGNRAFSLNKKIVKVNIPNSIRSIGDFAFMQCENLTEICIPPSVESVGEGAFLSCTRLNKVILPPGIKKLAPNTFAGCDNIKEVELSQRWRPLASNYFSSNPDFKDYNDSYLSMTKTSVKEQISEIDVDIPMATTISNKTLALVIANENYTREPDVEFAINDGATFSNYLKCTFGIPEDNLLIIENATLNEMKYGISFLERKCAELDGISSVIFYFAGHGVPDMSSRESYMLPVDGYGSDTTTGFPITELYHRLGELPSKQVLAVLDACFSGSQRNGNMLSSTRGVRIKPKTSKVKGNLVVLSATKEDESAFPFYEKQHGLFTYFLLKKIQESKGEIPLGQLAEFINEEVRKTSVIKNNRVQTPTVLHSSDLPEWNSLKFIQ